MLNNVKTLMTQLQKDGVLVFRFEILDLFRIQKLGFWRIVFGF